MRTPQTPIDSGFSAVSTARDVLRGIDLGELTVVVTGGHAGIGLETTRSMVAAGATVIVPTRAPDRAYASLAGMARVEVAFMDLMDPLSIDTFASNFLASGRPLNLLINNAGIMAPPLTRDSRGYESQIATNHFGHFQLTARLWPALLRAGDARVVSLSSRAHQRSGVDLNDPHFLRHPYDRWKAYAQSKSANVLFTVGLDERAAPHNIRAFAVQPGLILTELGRHMTAEELSGYRLTREDMGSGTAPTGRSVDEGGIFKSTVQGAATTVWCATSPMLRGLGGVYCEDVNISSIRSDSAGGERSDGTNTQGYGVAAHAVDVYAASKLWELSELQTGVGFAP